MEKGGKLFLIRLPYWLGIVADALWAAALFSPTLFGLLTGRPDFNPDIEVRLIMGIGGTLMTGWTLLLIWALQEPVGRRAVSLLTAFPVVFGMFVIAMIGFIRGGTVNVWILCKTTVLFFSMIASYLLARGIERQRAQGE
jgi:hypothetical protein